MANRYSNSFSSRKPKNKRKSIEIKNSDFLPARHEFNSNKQELDLKRGREKAITFFSEGIKKSIHDTGLRFINYISDYNQEKKVSTTQRFSENMDLIKEEITQVGYNERALSILSLYVQDEITNLPGIVKSDIKTSLGQQDGIRVYWYLDLDIDKLVIICLDPQHLVIPSDHDGKGKVDVMYETFDKTLNSKRHCISSYFS